MKKILISILFLASVFVSNADAQVQSGNKGSHEEGRRAERGVLNRLNSAERVIFPKLNLSRDQREQATVLKAKLIGDLRTEVREKARQGNSKPHAGKYRTILRDYRQQFLAILTPDQRKIAKVEAKKAKLKWRASRAVRLHKKGQAGELGSL